MDPIRLERPRLLYFADTMCSWCYGFAPEMQLVLCALGDRADLMLFAGGLRPFTREPMPPDLRASLQSTYARIGELSGQPFAPAWALNEAFVYDTEPASRAVVTVRTLAPGEEYPFMSAIQSAFYAGGEDITQTEVLARHAAKAGLAPEIFVAAFTSEALKQATIGDFQVAQKFGIDGFPTIVLHQQDSAGEDRLSMIAQGYSKAQIVIDRLRSVLESTDAA